MKHYKSEIKFSLKQTTGVGLTNPLKLKHGSFPKTKIISCHKIEYMYMESSSHFVENVADSCETGNQLVIKIEKDNHSELPTNNNVLQNGRINWKKLPHRFKCTVIWLIISILGVAVQLNLVAWILRPENNITIEQHVSYKYDKYGSDHEHRICQRSLFDLNVFLFE